MNCVILIERPFGLYIELQEDTPNPRLEGYDYTTLNNYYHFNMNNIIKMKVKTESKAQKQLAGYNEKKYYLAS